MDLDILAFGAHPDDVEISASGTILKHVAMKKSVGVVDLTRGELGTRGNAELRAKEAEKAAKILGLSVRINLGLPDGFFEVNESSIRKVVEQIRAFKPEIVLCNAISDRHPDHGRASKLVSDACFFSGLAKYETELNGKKQSAWRPKAVYHYIQDRYTNPDIVIDITDFFKRKMDSIMAYETQVHNPDSKEPQTPISTPEFLEYIKARDAHSGRFINVAFAEGFTVERAPGVKSLFDLV
ncbi:MAG: bacillithiol biosynthesis deacetylase BshB1 [Bacteroidota bacterium]